MSKQFYNQNQNRKYPFSDRASLMDDFGNLLPDGLFVDLSLTLDSAYGNDAYVSGITKGAGTVTVVISAVSDNLPLAVGKISSESQLLYLGYKKSSQVKLDALTAGISGSIIFGEQFLTIPDGSWSFSTPQASILSPRCVFPVAIPGGQRVGIYHAGIDLAGIVSLGTEGDVEIAFEDRDLNGVTVKAVVFRLKGSSQVLSTYSASLPRPESRTCGDPQPIEAINNVQPDCCGRIFIELRGCAVPVPILNHCGVVLECSLTSTDICPAKNDFNDIPQTDLCAAESGDNAIAPSDIQPDAPY